MIRNLIAAALLALVLAPLVSLHQLGAIDSEVTLSILEDGGDALYILEIRGVIGLDPLLAAVLP